MSDIVSLDDLSLDDLLGEFTEDETYEYEDSSDEEFFAPKKTVNAKKKAPVSEARYVSSKDKHPYKCPHCTKTYKTISGFQNHAGKQHNMPDERACDNRLDGPSADSSINIKASDTVVPLQREVYDALYRSTFTRTLDYLREGRFDKIPSSKHWRIMTDIANMCKTQFPDFETCLEPLQGELFDIFAFTNEGGRFSSTREKMLTKFQLYESQTGLHTRLAATLDVPVLHARAFIHIFYWNSSTGY